MENSEPLSLSGERLVSALTEERYVKHTEQVAKQQGYGSTDAGLALVEHYFNSTLSIVQALDKPAPIQSLPDDLIAVLALQSGISSVAMNHNINETVYFLGGLAEREVYAQSIRGKATGSQEKKKQVEKLAKAIMRKNGGLKQRKTAFRAAAQKIGMWSRPWPAKTLTEVGGWLVDVCLATDVFVLDDTHHMCMTLTEEALSVVHTIVSSLMFRRPYMLPLLACPDNWVDMNNVFLGYKHRLIRSHDNVVRATVSSRIKDGSMQPVLDAINAIQATAYKINPFISDMVRWAYDNDIPIKKFPTKSDLPIPHRPLDWDTLTEGKQKAWKKTAFDTYLANRGSLSSRLSLTQDLNVVDYIGDKPFWTPVNMDYRGRVYPIGNFNFQRSDHIRGMFLFNEGKPLDADGLYWLKVHLANCGDFEKVSKKPFADRVAWVEANRYKIWDQALDPKANLWWTKADCPFQFLAACKAWVDYIDDPKSLCHLPVGFDGSCSGLQHLAAMTKCDDTASLVNLKHTERPGDVYATVAAKAKAAIEDDLHNSDDLKKRLLASVCLSYGVDRSLVKRNVMTYSYSSGRFGMREQHIEDTMAPLSFKVLKGDLDKHPFEIEGDFTPGYQAARYLADHVYAAIEDTVKLPAVAMRYLQKLARAAAHESKFLLWTTPLGLPVVLRYPNYNQKQITLWLHDRGIKIRTQPCVREETSTIDKAKAAAAVAPCFVHSMDAAHLQKVVLDAKTSGINSLALVHDSFGCLPTDAGKLRPIIQEAFRWLYAEHDVLGDLYRETVERLDNKDVPTYEEYGTYDINQIMEAEYAFA